MLLVKWTLRYKKYFKKILESASD